jgi:hypothetical protein
MGKKGCEGIGGLLKRNVVIDVVEWRILIDAQRSLAVREKDGAVRVPDGRLGHWLILRLTFESAMRVWLISFRSVRDLLSALARAIQTLSLHFMINISPLTLPPYDLGIYSSLSRNTPLSGTSLVRIHSPLPSSNKNARFPVTWRSIVENCNFVSPLPRSPRKIRRDGPSTSHLRSSLEDIFVIPFTRMISPKKSTRILV